MHVRALAVGRLHDTDSRGERIDGWGANAKAATSRRTPRRPQSRNVAGKTRICGLDRLMMAGIRREEPDLFTPFGAQRGVRASLTPFAAERGAGV